MSTFIALLRGIGGGIRTMPMQKLTDALGGIGLQKVRTYIATGNVVFESRKTAAQLQKDIEACVQKTFGYESQTFLLNIADLKRAIKANPFPQADENHKSLHLFFLAGAAKTPKLDVMNELKAPTEAYVLTKKVLYFYAPQGFGISKLGGRLEKLLGVATTARNWRTVNKLLELATA